MTVIPLATPLTVGAAWERYVELVRAAKREPALMINLDHQIATVRAWKVWRDLFLTMDGQC